MAGKPLCGDVLLVPMHLSGHVNPMMHVVKQLVEKGITATMLLFEKDESLLTSHLKNGGMELFGVHWLKAPEREGPPRGGPKMHQSFAKCCEPFMEQLVEAQRAGEEGPKCLIADQFMGWSQDWADKLQIPSYVSIVSPATFGYCMYNHSRLLERDNLLERKAKGEDPEINLPGLSPWVHLLDLPGAAFKTDSFMTESGDKFGRFSGFLFNTFYGLEKSIIQEFDKQVKTEHGEKAPKMLPIGPMLPVEFFQEQGFEGTQQDNECIKWLNTRSPSSVVYIAFGSAAYLSEPQIVELANALEASKVAFLWVLRVKSSPRQTEKKTVSEILPPGFLDRTKDQGYVYSEFAPQLQILSHSSVGGFLSHCGWNSLLESICRGIPIVGWPMSAEQKLCCRVLQHANVTIPVRDDLSREDSFVRADDLEKALKLFMADPRGDELRKRAKELQVEARKATAPQGSSVRNFEYLVKVIQDRKNKTAQTQ